MSTELSVRVTDTVDPNVHPPEARRRAGSHCVPAPIRFGWAPGPALILAAVTAIGVAVLALLVAVDAQHTVPTPIRLLVTLAAATLVPGIPVVVALRIPGRALGSSLVVTVSLATTILTSQFTIMVEWWHPLITQLLLALVSLVACAFTWWTLPQHCVTPTGPMAPARRSGRLDASRAASSIALAVSLALFVVQTRTLDFLGSGTFGIITRIGVVYVVGFLILAATIVHTLTRTRIDHLVMSGTTALLVTYTTMLVPSAAGETTVPTAFVHRGFIATLVESGALPAAVDARFSWAGFFSAGAHMVTVAGVPSAQPFLTLAPLAFGVLMAFPLYAIAVAITGSARLAWLSLVLYQLFNWYQQDYYAPQAVALLFYSTIVATLLWQLRRAPLPRIRKGLRGLVLDAPRRTPGLVPGFGSGRTLAVGAVLLLLVVADTVTHQITPILAIVTLGFFSLFGVTRYRTLWLAAGLVFAAWFSYGATDYWMGHLQALFDEIGQVGNSVERGVNDRLNGDPTYQKMQYLRMGASALFAGTAFVGWLIARNRRTWLIAGFVSGAPFSLVVLQSYGGEMIIRCFVLASPILAPLAAIAVASTVLRIRALLTGSVRTPASRAMRWIGAATMTVVVLVTGMVLTTNRGLNTAFEATTMEQVEVTDRFVAAIPPDSTIMSWSHAPHTVSARRILDPRAPRMQYIDSYPCLDNLASCADDRAPTYIYVTSQGVGMLRYQYGMSNDYLSEQLSKTTENGQYITMYQRPSITILRRSDAPALDLGAS